jgi:hypothetical protein
MKKLMLLLAIFILLSSNCFAEPFAVSQSIPINAVIEFNVTTNTVPPVEKVP